MNAGGPKCASCGAVMTNPQSTQCHFCGNAIAPQYAAPPAGGYGAPPPGAYGAPPPYGAQPYGAPPPPYGGYGGPQPYPQVQGFGGVQPFNQGYPPQYRSNGWSSGWSTFFWVRLAIAAVVIGMSLVGACVNALTH